MANNAGLNGEIVGGPLTHIAHHITQSGAHTANGGKRKHKHTGLNSGVTKSMKESGTASMYDGNGAHSAHRPSNNDRNAHTSIDWKIAKKKGIGLTIHNQSNSVHPQKTDFSIFQENIIVAPQKTQSGRPTKGAGSKIGNQ